MKKLQHREEGVEGQYHGNEEIMAKIRGVFLYIRGTVISRVSWKLMIIRKLFVKYKTIFISINLI